MESTVAIDPPLLAADGWLLLGAQPPELPPIGGGSREPGPPPLPPISAPRTGEPAANLPPPLPPRGDLELIERVIAARKAYAAALKDLQEHYRLAGDDRRARLADDELKGFNRSPRPAYRVELDVPNPNLRPTYDQKGANDLYRWAKTYKDRGLGADYLDNQRRAELLLQELLTKYPQSTRIGDAAYVLGELYEGRAFRQFERAAAYYERSFQWDPNVPLDARLRAARLYDRELRDRAKAVELYRLVLDIDTSPTRRQEAQRRLYDLGAR